jgi:hypothetical protein
MWQSRDIDKLYDNEVKEIIPLRMHGDMNMKLEPPYSQLLQWLLTPT